MARTLVQQWGFKMSDISGPNLASEDYIPFGQQSQIGNRFYFFSKQISQRLRGALARQAEELSYPRLIAKARHALSCADYDGAVRWYQQAIELNPANSAALVGFDQAVGFTQRFPALLHRLDASSPRNRIYILGCARSGTTLLLALMTCFRDVYVLIDEASLNGEDYFGRFARLRSKARTHIIKRTSNAYSFSHLIPDCIRRLVLVRHPFDVLVSTLVLEGRSYRYYVSPERWKAECSAIRRIVDQKRDCCILRYEDLVTAPDKVQYEIAKVFELETSSLFSLFPNNFNATTTIIQSMHGLRAPSPASIGRWRQNREHLAYIRSLLPTLREDVEWFCNQFNYELMDQI
jgi:hypothetical protein